MTTASSETTTQFVVTDTSADAEMIRGYGQVVIHGYTATPRCDGQQIGESEFGDCEVRLTRSERPFPWMVGETVEIGIPWNGGVIA